jgi:hypothetical protein
MYITENRIPLCKLSQLAVNYPMYTKILNLNETKGQTMIYKTLQRKLKIKQHEHHKKLKIKQHEHHKKLKIKQHEPHKKLKIKQHEHHKKLKIKQHEPHVICMKILVCIFEWISQKLF